MAVRFRFRRVHAEQEWSEPFRLRRVMSFVRHRQEASGGPYRQRRRDHPWKRWFRYPKVFRIRFRTRLRLDAPGVFQFQVGGAGGPIYAVLKYRLIPAPTIGERVIAAAKTEIGTKYRFGEANGPEDPGSDAFDCSGFCQWAWGTEGVYLPHGAELMRVAGNVSNFTSEGDAIAGDLVFMWFPNTRGIPPNRASHVGLHLGDGRTGMVIDTRNPYTSPVGIRPSAGVIGYGRPHAGGQQR